MKYRLMTPEWILHFHINEINKPNEETDENHIFVQMF